MLLRGPMPTSSDVVAWRFGFRLRPLNVDLKYRTTRSHSRAIGFRLIGLSLPRRYSHRRNVAGVGAPATNKTDAAGQDSKTAVAGVGAPATNKTAAPATNARTQHEHDPGLRNPRKESVRSNERMRTLRLRRGARIASLTMDDPSKPASCGVARLLRMNTVRSGAAFSRRPRSQQGFLHFEETRAWTRFARFKTAS